VPYSRGFVDCGNGASSDLEIVRKPKGQSRFAVVALAMPGKLLVPRNNEIDIFRLNGIPMFNEDDEKHPPSSVLELRIAFAAPMLF